MANALWITIIGMGLVFVAILLLWGLMALLVRLTAEKEPAAGVLDFEETVLPAPGAVSGGAPDQDRKRRAAAAAVAVALSLRPAGVSVRANKPENSMSPWQAAHRAGLMSQRANSRRKVVR